MSDPIVLLNPAGWQVKAPILKWGVRAEIAEMTEDGAASLSAALINAAE